MNLARDPAEVTVEKAQGFQAPISSFDLVVLSPAAAFTVVNGDGKNDIITAKNAHGWGLSWFEQKRGADGAIN